MLQINTAYPITESNAHVLSHLTGQPKKMLLANVGWCATYSTNRVPYWQIVPRDVAVYDMGFMIDEVTYP